jgi:hypothetical protein
MAAILIASACTLRPTATPQSTEAKELHLTSIHSDATATDPISGGLETKKYRTSTVF